MVVLLLDLMRWAYIWAIHGAQQIFSVRSMVCVNRDCTVYFNAHTQYGMCTTHCVTGYLVGAVELIKPPIP